MPSRRGLTVIWAAVLVLVLASPATAAASRYYLSLGDSLAQGMQPNGAGITPAGGSQMLAAERFLRRHRRAGEVALVTLDIGANDVDGCEHGIEINTGCVIAGVGRIATNLPVILRRLRSATAPGTPMAAMTLYDPFLELFLSPGGREEALASVRYARNVNAGLTRLYRAGRLPRGACRQRLPYLRHLP